MRHRKRTFMMGRTGSHRRALLANMAKSLVVNNRIETTVPKAKEVRRFAEKMVTLAKRESLASERHAIKKLQIRYNSQYKKQPSNTDRQVMPKLKELGTRFQSRNGGYTRITRTRTRRGDAAPMCVLEFLT